MADVSFDTLAMMRQLETKGFESVQAEAIANAVRTGVSGGVATKEDLARVEANFDSRLTRFEADFDSRLTRFEASFETRLTRFEASFETRLSRVENDLLWIKRIGAVIVALLVVPLVRDLLAALN